MRHKKVKSLISAVLITGAVLTSTYSFAQIIEKPVTFKKGSYGTVLKGSFKGYDTIHYTVYAKAGQQLALDLIGKNNLAEVNIFAPGDRPGISEAISRSSVDGGSLEITLNETGTYTIQVYQMRNTARRGQVANYNIDLKIFN